MRSSIGVGSYIVSDFLTFFSHWALKSVLFVGKAYIVNIISKIILLKFNEINKLEFGIKIAT